MTDYGCCVEVDEFSGADPCAKLFNAIDYAASVGGGKVILPRSIDPLVITTPLILDSSLSRVSIQGHGLSTVILNGTTAGQWFYLEGCDNFGLYDLRIDGNRRNGGLGHGFRIGNGGAKNCTIERVKLEDSYGYGLAAQLGDFSGLRVRDIEVDGCGLDGIDLKNMEDTNRSIFIDGAVIKNFGQDVTPAPPGETKSPCAGMDVRGRGFFSRLEIHDVGILNAKGGIRFRFGELDSPSGYGGHFFKLDQFDIYGAQNPDDTTSVGLDNGAYRTMCTNGRVEGVYQGVANNQVANKYSNVDVQHCKQGWVFQDLTGSGLPTRGERATLISCSAEACVGGNGFDVKTNDNDFIGCTSRGNSRGFHFQNSSGNRVTGGSSLSNQNANKGAASYVNHTA